MNNTGKAIIAVVIPGLIVYFVYFLRYLSLDTFTEIFNFQRNINSYTWIGVGCFVGSLLAWGMISENNEFSGGDLIGMLGFTGVGLIIIMVIDFLLTGGKILLG